MCVISNKIKLCTCAETNIDIYEFNHYWVLYRYNDQKYVVIEGQAILPCDMFVHKNYEENQLTISKALAEKSIFDKDIRYKEKDRLEIVINNNSDNIEEIMEFDFIYSSGTWQSITDYDPFYRANNYDEIASGEITELE